MGLHSDIWKYIVQTYFAPNLRRATSGEHALLEHERQPGARIAYISDFFTQVRHVGAWHPDSGWVYEITTTELVDHIIEGINGVFSSGDVEYYIIVADVQYLVPAEKRAEQRRRSWRQGEVPYDANSRFVSGGIIENYEAALCMFRTQVERGMHTFNGVPPGTGLVAVVNAFERIYARPFKTARVLSDRQLREKMVARVAYELSRRPYAFVEGGKVIVDSRADGACVYVSDGESRVVERLRTHGEADTQMMTWVHYFASHRERQFAVWVDSIDSDFIPMLALYVHRRRELARDASVSQAPAAITLWRDELRGLDMVGMVERMVEHHAWNPVAFACASILCGTDFILKRMVTFRIGVPMVFWGVLGPGAQHAVQTPASREAFGLLLRVVWSEEYSPNFKGKPSERIKRVASRLSTLREVAASRRPSDPPLTASQLREIATRAKSINKRFPDEADLDAAWRLVRFNLGYWDMECFKRDSLVVLPEDGM